MDTPAKLTSYDLLKLPAVMAKTTFSEPSIYRLMREGKFPKPLKLGERAVAWRSDEIEAFIKALPRSRVGDTVAFYTEVDHAA